MFKKMKCNYKTCKIVKIKKKSRVASIFCPSHSKPSWSSENVRTVRRMNLRFVSRLYASMNKLISKVSPRQQPPSAKASKTTGPLEKTAAVSFEVLPTPDKSSRDKKEYKVIRLPNGLTACLISEPISLADCDSGSDEDEGSECETDDETEEEDDEEEAALESENDDEMKKVPEVKQKMAAAALCVGVGSFSDPKDIPGLAHFLEHMVFMGSKKFPNENDFDKYISKRGGFDNASTDCETTTFYFECLEKYLFKSLDKFAQFFISPLMKKGSMTREREAVDSEFQMSIHSDLHRKEQMLLSMFNPKVPVNDFCWGNLITLKDNVTDNVLYEALHEFRKRHYSAHRMTLCIQARLPIETLQHFVLNCFKDVPTNNLEALGFKQYAGLIYDNPLFNKLYYVIPSKDMLELDITWSLPSLQSKYKCKPHQYISWLLGHEGNGSLISYLKKKVWALAIYSGNGETGSEHNSMYSYFTLTLTLTQTGISNIFEIIEHLFSYINLLRKEGPQEWIFNEIKLIERTAFEYADEKVSSDMVEEVAESMQFYPSEDYLTGSELFFEYSPQDIQIVLNYLRPDNMNIMVFNKRMPEDVKCDQVERWFSTKYDVKDIPNKWLETWTNAEPLPEFSLPVPNAFLTDDFSILPHLKDNPEYPTKILCNDTVELWYRFDQKFNTPTAYIYYLLVSPLTVDSPTNSCLLDMFIILLGIQVTEEAYPAQLAGLDYSISHGDKGLQFKINGFNQKLPALVELLAKYSKNVADNLTPEMFEAVKDKHKMFYYNKFLKPSTLNKDIRLALLLSRYWTAVAKHEAISKITFDMMKDFANSYMRHLYIQALIQGNISADTARKTTENLIEILGCKPLAPDTFPKIRVIQLPQNEHCLRIKSFNKINANSYVTNYYQTGPFTLKDSVIIELLMMIIEEPMFNELRTKEQLGYSVSCTLRQTFGILGFSLSVNTQADKHSTEHIDVRIEAFVKHVQKLLKKMYEKKLSQFKRDLIKVKHITDTRLPEEVDRNWVEIINRDYMFDRLRQEAHAIEEIKLADVRKFWDDHNLCGRKNNSRKISIQVVGHADAEKNKLNAEEVENLGNQGDFKVELLKEDTSKEKEKRPEKYFIDDIELFKQDLFLYPSKTSLK